VGIPCNEIIDSAKVARARQKEQIKIKPIRLTRADRKNEAKIIKHE
jgi:hypothetical protein